MAERRYWKVMTYACDGCGLRIDFYLEDGCEGPRDRQVPFPQEKQAERDSAPAVVKDLLPDTVPQTASGRYVLAVPFIAGGCPDCQGLPPWNVSNGVLEHVDWHLDRPVDTTEPPPDAGRFHYPADWTKERACGVPVLPEEVP